MPLTFPLSTAQFVEKLRIVAIVPYLQFQQELSALTSGGVVAKDLAPALWMADIQTASLKSNLLAQLEATIEAMHGSIGTFYCYDTQRWYPQSDPRAVLLGASVVTIHALPDNVSISLAGLPPGYVITAGDRFHFDYGPTLITRAFHRAAETVTADPSGVTPPFTVTPYLRPGVATGIIVTLVKPAALMRIVPGSHAIAAGLLGTIQFKAQQVIL